MQKQPTMRERLAASTAKLGLEKPTKQLKAKADPPATDSKPPTKVVYLCGHAGANVPCGQCQSENARRRAANRQAHLETKREPSQEGRLPEGSVYSVHYDAVAVLWNGSLTVPGVGTFIGQASGVFRLLIDLDMQYRAAISS